MIECKCEEGGYCKVHNRVTAGNALIKERIKLDSRFGKLTNTIKVKRFEDGNMFVTIRNGYDKETGKQRGACILLKPDQIKILKEWL